MTTTAIETQTFTITEDITVHASIDQTFASLIAQMGRLNELPDGTPMPMVIEPSSCSPTFVRMQGFTKRTLS